MKLVLPTAEYKASLLAAAAEHEAAGETLDYTMLPTFDDFDEGLLRLQDHAAGRNLEPGWVADTTYWLVDDGEYIGRISVRHQLNDRLRQVGGHIGYNIRPSKRRQGCGGHILRLVLPEAKQLGINPALVTCNDDNIASWKIIEANGGKLENKIELDGRLIRHYWVETA